MNTNPFATWFPDNLAYTLKPCFIAVLLLAFVTPSIAATKLPKVDLRADVNRDGNVYLGSAADDRDDKRGQASWTMKRGAIVLPNLDDDANRCDEKSAIVDLSVTGCHDGKDSVVNGGSDLADLAPLRLMPWPDAPDQATASVMVGPNGLGKARVFIQQDGQWQLLPRELLLTANKIRQGVDLRIEALDVVRDPRVWDGRIDVVAKVSDGTKKVSDTVQFRVAPLLLQSDLMKMKRLYLPGMPWAQDGIFSNLAANISPLEQSVTGLALPGKPFQGYLSILDAANPNASHFAQRRFARAKLGLLGSAFKAFHDDFVFAAKSAQPGTHIANLSTFEDPWVQDMFEMAYATMPKPNGKAQIIYLALRSPQPQRMTAQLPLAEALGPNVGIVEQWADDSGLARQNGDYSSNSTGNFGMIPPYSFNGKHYPLGRIVYGAGDAWMQTGGGIIDSSIALGNVFKLKPRFPDRSFVRMLAAQAMQKPLVIDSAWLSVGHIDEIVAFVPAATERGWKVVVADPLGAWNLLSNIVANGLGDSKFLSKLEPWADGLVPEEVAKTVNDVFNNRALNRAQIITHRKIAGVIRTLKAETGIVDSDIIRVPVLFEASFFNNRSYFAKTPNAANLVVLSQGSVAVAKQHGPLINGVDVFEKAIATALGDSGLSVQWVEDYVQAHGGNGEIHCQSNVLRDPGGLSKWWIKP